MSVVYRYCIQQRTPPTPGVVDGFIRDVRVTDPSVRLITNNALGIADTGAFAQTQIHYGNPLGVYRIIIAEIVEDSANQANNSVPYRYAFPWLTKESVDQILARFDSEITTVEPKPPHHKP